MSWYASRRSLEDGTEELRVPVPQHGAGQRVVFVVEGTFTGTLSAEKADGTSLSIVEATSGATASDPTGTGVFYVNETLNPGDQAAVLSFSSYTSGAADVAAVVVPNA